VQVNANIVDSFNEIVSHVEGIFNKKGSHHGHHHHHDKQASASSEVATAVAVVSVENEGQDLGHATIEDIWNSVEDTIKEQLRLKEQAAAVVSHPSLPGDDYPDCNTTVVNTTDHILDVTISFIEKKCSNESLPDKAKKVCQFLTTHEEGVKGFLVGFFDLYLLSYFYAAGAGKCSIHPFNMSHIGDYGNFNLMKYAGVYDGYTSYIGNLGEKNIFEIQAALYDEEDENDDDDDIVPAYDTTTSMAIEHVASSSSSSSSNSHEHFLKRMLHEDSDVKEGKQVDTRPSPGKDKKRCIKCYGKVVGKYIKTVMKIGKKFCDQTKCDYAKRVCDYLESHEEYTIGLIIGKLRPFKFAAGYCMGSKQCHPSRPHPDQLGDSMGIMNMVPQEMMIKSIIHAAKHVL